MSNENNVTKIETQRDIRERIEREEIKVMTDIVMDRLSITPVTDDVINISNKVKRVIARIAKIEDKWEATIPGDKRRFGQKRFGETIKLWSVPERSALMIANIAIKIGAKNILEIGTSAGFSTLFLAEVAKENGGEVLTIESFDEKVNMAKKNFDDAGVSDNVTIIQGNASYILDRLNYGIDFVFLDADKENYGKYLDLILPKMKIGGIIIADNVNDYGHMMEDFLQRVSGTHFPGSRCDKRVISTYLPALDNGLMIVKKIAN